MSGKSQPDAPEPLPREPGRLASAWAVLKGQRLTPLQVQHEWLSYKQIFDDVLNRLGAQLARQQKAHNERIRASLEETGPIAETGSLTGRKDALRRRFAEAKGIHMLRPQGNAVPAPQPEESP